MDHILFIVNPIAGGGKAKKLIPIINQAMCRTRRQYKIILTKKPKDAIKITQEGINQGYKILVAVGGDGTVNEVARGILIGGHGKLAILPSGTGNDMARSLNIDLDPIKAMDIIINGSKKNVDIGTVNNRLFLNIASIGFDAETVKNTENVKKRIRSNIAYVIGVLITLFGFKDKEIRMEIDDTLISRRVSLIAIGNGQYYGGGLKILPMAINDDGYLYICIVNKVSKLKLLFLFPTIFKGQHIKLKKYVEIFKAKRVKVQLIGETYLNVDGEVYGLEEETLFTISDNKLPVLVKAPL